jgi:hypothetical protein
MGWHADKTLVGRILVLCLIIALVAPGAGEIMIFVKPHPAVAIGTIPPCFDFRSWWS